jgi:ankyrin repeat protein
LLEHGANVNAYGPLGTALMYAAANGRVEVIRLLLEHPEIDVNRQKNGETAPDVAKGREAKKLIAHAGGRKGNSH